MAVEWVVDASVIGAVLFEEENSILARRFLAEIIEAFAIPIAPDLLLLEMASIAAKKRWRGEVSEIDATGAVDAAPKMAKRPIQTAGLAPRAYVLAAAHRFSAYDATYLALAELRGCRVATLDRRLADRAEREGLAHLVHAIA